MISREFLAIALGNLWRLKLRSTLTITGVMVGIGALVSMLSFGHGMQKNVTGEFQKIGLLRTMQVFSGPVPGEHERHPGGPGESDREPGPGRRHSAAGAPDSSSAAATGPPLDQAAIGKIAALEGVALVYPQESFDARIEWGGRTENAKVQALPAAFTAQRPFGRIRGRFFASDSASEAVISGGWLKDHGIEPDSILGDTLTIRATGSGEVILLLAGRELGRMGLPGGITAAVRKIGTAILPFVFRPSSGKMAVVGVTDFQSGFGFNTGSVLIPLATSARLDHLSFSDPYQLLSMLSDDAPGGYRMLVVTVTDERVYSRVRAGIEAMGFHVFSFVDQFDQIRKSFLMFDAMVGAIGFLALFIAGLSIVNTMVMSIVERTREIGILKSLGAEEGEIRALFLVESAAIGLIGSAAGLILGYGVSRLGALIFRRIMLAQGGPDIDPFSLSLSIVLGAVAFGVGVSLIAGLYPAARAARVDPVMALRQE